MKTIYLIFNSDNKVRNFDSTLEDAFERYNYLDLDFSVNLKQKIKDRIYLKKDFEITINELKEIIPAFEKKIDELLLHPDFNPFKEELRKKYSEQFSNLPLLRNNKTYYLYNKGREFYIDSLIYGLISFKKLIEELIESNKNLKYVYKKN